MTNITHIAAPPVLLETRIIQRCSLCGTKLLDIDRDEPEHIPWIAGKFIATNGNFNVMLPFTDEIPNNLCYNEVVVPVILEIK